MKCRTVTNRKGEDFLLTEDEEKFLKGLERLSKIDSGRLYLFGSGVLDVRINDTWADDSIDNHNVYLQCEGGDGGDNK